jgi:hypothetical protein
LFITKRPSRLFLFGQPAILGSSLTRGERFDGKSLGDWLMLPYRTVVDAIVDAGVGRPRRGYTFAGKPLKEGLAVPRVELPVPYSRRQP